MQARRTRGWQAVATLTLAGVSALALIACGEDGPADRSTLPSMAEGPSTSNVAPPRDAAGSSGSMAMPAPMPASGAAELKSLDSAGVAGMPPQGGSDAEQLLGRSIIRSGSLDLEVRTVIDAFARVRDIATANGGFVADSRFFGKSPSPQPVDGGRQPDVASLAPSDGAALTIRVPAERFEDVVAQLRGIAVEARTVSTSAQDITAEVTDLDSSLRNLRAVEARYLELLGRAQTIADVLQVQDRLNQTRDQIERTEGRIQMLARLSDMATISVTLRPVAPPPPIEASGLGHAAGQAWEASLDTLRAGAIVVVQVLVYSWWLLPLIALGAWVARRWLRASSASGAAPLASIDTPQGTA